MHLSRAIESNCFNHLTSEVDFASDDIDKHIYCIENSSINKAVELEYPFGRAPYRVLGSFNGIVCIDGGFNGDVHTVSLFNSSTREYKKNVDVGNWFKEYIYGGACAYGFGYDSANDDYILVEIDYDLSCDDSRVNVYSLNSASCLTSLDNHHEIYYAQSGVLCNGSLYWLAYVNDSSGLEVIIFDIGKKAFSKVPCPADLTRYPDSCDSSLGLLGGKICMLCNYCNAYEIEFMDNYGLNYVSLKNLFPKWKPISRFYVLPRMVKFYCCMEIT